MIGCAMSCVIEVAMHAMVLLFSTARLGVERPNVLAEVLVLHVSLA